MTKPSTELPTDLLRRWLAAEREVDAYDAPDALDASGTSAAGATDDREALAAATAAEAALAEMFAAALEPLAPSSGFADRVLRHVAATVPAPAPAPARSLASRWAKAGLLAAAALSVLLSLPWLPVAARVLLKAASLSALLQAGVGSAVDLGQGLAALVALGTKLLMLIRVFASPLATPPIALLGLLCLLVSVLALRCLHDVIQRDRRWVYVDPI